MLNGMTYLDCKITVPLLKQQGWGINAVANSVLANSDATDQIYNAPIVSGASRTPPNLNAVVDLIEDPEPLPITISTHQLILRAHKAIETWDDEAFTTSKMRAPVPSLKKLNNCWPCTAISPATRNR
jgi:hypothetical protein